MCEKSHHDVEDCPTFLTQPVQDRSKTIFKKKLRYGCLAVISKDPNAKKYSNRKSCKVCNGSHLTTLHGVKLDKKDKASIKDEKRNGEQNEEMKCASINTYSDVVSMCIVPVRFKRKDSINEVQTYALLDSCSQGTFILDKLAKAVGTSGRKTSITIKTINGEHTSSSMVIEDLQVANTNNEEDGWIDLPKTYTKPDLPVDKADVTQPSQLKQWKYLDHITNQLNLEDNLPVGLLIGANCVKALEPLEILQSRNEGPYAFKTRLGWCIVGPVSQNNKNTVSCNRIAVRQADTKQVGTHFFQVGNQVHDNEVPDMLKKIYNHDFTESHHMANKEMVGASQEDKRFLQILEEGAKLVNGLYEIPLPFRRVGVQLPNNKVQAEKRLASLKKKMARNNKFKDDYIEFMKELTSKGYAKESSKVAEQVIAGTYPTMVCTTPNKPRKIHVVFNLSAEHHGASINKELLP